MAKLRAVMMAAILASGTAGAAIAQTTDNNAPATTPPQQCLRAAQRPVRDGAGRGLVLHRQERVVHPLLLCTGLAGPTLGSNGIPAGMEWARA